MSQRDSKRDFDAEVRQSRVETLLNDAAEYTIEAEMPVDLVANALNGGSICCLSSTRKRLALSALAGVASVCLLIVGVRLTRSPSSHMPLPMVPNTDIGPRMALKTNPSRDPSQVAAEGVKQGGTDFREASNSKQATLFGGESHRLVSAHAPQAPAPKRASARAHNISPKAIWNEEIVQTREQGILIPIVTVEPVPNSQDSEVKSGVAVVPVRSGVTRCESPTAPTKDTNPPNTSEER